ncbi:MAG TPA: ATP-binding protein, partial [Kofleriaceae bacterium]|nr:ATP-binding protein [Kofleriaceae bacterium]
MSRRLRLLLVEDSEDDALLVTRELARNGFDLVSHRVWTEPALVAALDETWDLAISDFQMPAFDGLQAFEILHREAPDLPVIFVSGVLGEDRAVEAMRVGARDYIVKGNLARLGSAVRRELADADERRRRIEAERALAIEERRFRSIFESASVGIVEIDVSAARQLIEAARAQGLKGREWLRTQTAVVDQAGAEVRVVTANQAALTMLSAITANDVLRTFVRAISPDTRSSLWHDLLDSIASRISSFEREVEVDLGGGRTAHLLVTGRLSPDLADLHNVVLSLLDLAERRRLESQMRASQRMESVGRLAGGIAHDFNNVLAVITTSASFLADELHETTGREDLVAIQDAAKRAAALTHQLLAFSRRQPQHPRVLDLNEIVRSLDRMLRRVIGEDIKLSLMLDDDLGRTRADPSQIEQILLNLLVNAREAMPLGGKVSIETANVELGADYGTSKAAEVPSGSYVLIAVTDSGSGMDEDTRSRVFEPFFTTKPAGTGTGLGLATVYGIVKQSNGFVWVYSEPGHGTTFKIYLPRIEEEVTTTSHDKGAKPDSLPRGSEVVLLVEDEAGVR